MDLHRWKAKFFDDIRVFDRQGFTHSLALDPFGRQAGAGNRTAAAKCLEFGVLDDSGFFINFDLKLHYIAALRRSYKAGAHIGILFGKRTEVTRLLVVIYDFVRICHFFAWFLLCEERAVAPAYASVAQCTDFKSIPSFAISYKGDSSRSRRTTSITRPAT